MNFGQFKTKTKLRLSNMQSDDPWETYVGDWVNEALNAVIMRTLSQRRSGMNLFLELRDEWQDATTLNQRYVDLPADLLVLERVYSFDKTSANANSDRRYPTVEISAHEYELLAKATTTVGYPRLWTRYGNWLKVHPIPRTGYTTDLLMQGVAKENTMSADADTPIISTLWHGAVEDYAVYLGATAMGWQEEAEAALQACDRKIMQTVDIIGLERASGNTGVKVLNDPTRAA